MAQDKDEKRNKENRTFLHDIATPMTIIGLSLKRIAGKPPGNGKSLSPEKQDELIEKVLESLEKLESLHANFKAVLASREKEDKKQ